MKTKKWNGSLAVMGIVFISAALISCGQDDLPSIIPDGHFQVNISSTSGIGKTYNGMSKTILINGDSIEFATVFSENLGHDDHWIKIIPSGDANYQYLTSADTTPWSYKFSAHYPTNVSTDSLPGSNRAWRDVINDTYGSELMVFGSTIWSDPRVFSDMPENEDRFVIFRKQSGSNYVYFWLRFRYTNFLYMQFTLTVLDGKYQMNSIITGQ